jgi:hypothetical protein
LRLTRRFCFCASGVPYLEQKYTAPLWKYTSPRCKHTSPPWNLKGHGRESNHSASQVVGRSNEVQYPRRCTLLRLGLSIATLAGDYSPAARRPYIKKKKWISRLPRCLCVATPPLHTLSSSRAESTRAIIDQNVTKPKKGAPLRNV